MEQLLIKLTKVKMSFSDTQVLDVPDLSVYQSDRIGIVGRNGSGKSTLLKLLGGVIEPDTGQVLRHGEFGYFSQTDAPVTEEADGALLSRFHVPAGAPHLLSGGEQTRLKLASLFSEYREGLLIDEPTTHLDRDGTAFLADELRWYYGTLVLVSHDRWLLDELVTKIWEVDDGMVKEYAGYYSDYEQHKQAERKRQAEEHEQYVKTRNRLLASAEDKMKKAEKIAGPGKQISKKETKATANRMFMTKSKGTSQKAAHQAAKAIEHRAEKLEKVDAPEQEKKLRFPLSSALTIHNKFPVMGDRLTLRAGDRVLLENTAFQFPLGRTIAITGPNGSGKSTLLKAILNGDEGIVLSPKTVFGVYEQLAYRFEKDETVLEYMRTRTDADESMIRRVLHMMHLSGNDLNKSVLELSGGEAARLVLCRLFMGQYNVLVLDEPTNFLDMPCMEALEQFIEAYEGTILLVSHDQALLNRTADCIYEIENQTLSRRK
ncbi:Msr family ABC-F type ribosomal protection protein [Alteribacter natronophilus]|uniref:Msr family ABC-F type ribosomal protection protein n=1 Tax=Alteribacter natronophilus TaxID=2583810 RepID=UPI00110E4E55|nr:ABC-F type ribosomal protection protein [Alteribacter natronophilus]TMW72764.1 ABC-F type ribosomal protection protein [Alteribacter natronophilus]